MIRYTRTLSAILLTTTLIVTGCRSPYYADRGALFGGLMGAGVGAIVGDAVGDAGAGAVIGAGVGAITGEAVGESLDEIDARNRAQIAAQLGRTPQAGAVTREEVIAMSRAGVAPQLITSHIRNNGMARPLTTADVIHLHQQGVATGVIEVMQSPPTTRMPAQLAPTRPVIIEEHYYGHPWQHFDLHHRPRHRRHRTSWGFSFSG